MESELKKYVEEALNRRLSETGFEESNQLKGDCLYNTKMLKNVLDNNSIAYSIYGGALIGDFTEKPKSFKDAKKIGLVHYWIESNGYICEICSESELYYGENVVLPFRPDNYIIFKDSKQESLI